MPDLVQIFVRNIPVTLFPALALYLASPGPAIYSKLLYSNRYCKAAFCQLK